MVQLNLTKFFLFILYINIQNVSTLQYEVGVVYEYQYLSSVTLTEPQADSSQVAFQISSTIQLKPIWKNEENQQLFLLKMQPQLLIKPKGKTNFEVHPSYLESTPSNPVVFALDKGRITHFFANPDEDTDLLNLKRGVVSLFQLQQVTGSAEEIDASGKCTVLYKISGSSTTKVKKSCFYNSHIAKDFTHTIKVFDTSLKVHREFIYQLTADDFIIQTAESHEQFQFNIKTLLSSSASVISKQKVSLLKQIQEEQSFQGNTLEQVIESVSKSLQMQLTTMEITLDDSQKTIYSKSLSEFIRDRKSHLPNKKLGKAKTAISFLQILNRIRHASKEEIIEVIKDPKNKNGLASLFDVLAAAQTNSAFQSAMDLIPNIHNPDTVERFLLALAVTPRPTEETLSRLKTMIENGEFKEPKVEETAILMLSSILNAYCQNIKNCKKPIARNTIKSLLAQLEHCKEDSCYLTYLRALRNAAQPSTIPTLLEHIKKGGKISSLALLAIKSMPKEAINNDVKDLLIQVFTQMKRRYDSTARLHAADILLQNEPTDEELEVIVTGLYESNEMSTYLLGRLKEITQTTPQLRDRLMYILHQPNINNYNVLAQPGISTAFTNMLLDGKQSNATYGFRMELAKGGLLKQSVFDATVNNDQSSLSVLGFGIFASGLSGLSGEEVLEDDEGDATAGIELTIMGVALRPYVFFVGQAELMSHAWAGTASEPTNILQGNLLLHDSHHRVSLSSGFLIDFSSKGVLSIDSSGSLQVSLWNRNSHTEIAIKGGSLIHGSASINSKLMATSVQFSASYEGNISVITDSEFYEAPFKMCTQMIQPNTYIKHLVRKTESIPSTKHRIRRTKRKTQLLVGKSYALHPKNTEFCGSMLQ